MGFYFLNVLVGILGKSSHATTQNKGKQAVLVSTFFYNNTSNNYIKKKQTNCIIFIVFMNPWQETCHRPNHRLPSKELDHESYNLEHIFLRLQCLCNLEEESIKKSKGKDSYRERGRGRNGQHGTGHPRKRGFSINCCLFAPYF